jgi:replication-associated recombination protein RarA
LSLKLSSRDPWVDVTSVRGLKADELISALQKYIRRGNLEEALLVAREMYETSPELETHLWTRLLVISASDCNDGTFLQTPVVESLNRVCLRMQRGTGERWLFIVQAVRYLVSSQKDMTSDEICMWSRHVMNNHIRGPVIPDYAIDCHTEAGRKMGRGVAHFLDEGTIVTNQYEGADPTFGDRVREIVSRGEWD